jgi:hypothetical protein
MTNEELPIGGRNVVVRAQTAQAAATVAAAGIASQLHWPDVWLRIGEAHVAIAAMARSDYQNDPSVSLSREFDAALVAIAACAFAVEAVEAAKIATLGDGPIPGLRPHVQNHRRNVGDHIGAYLREMGLITAPEVEQLGQLFALRHGSVHPESFLQPLQLHPAGARTSPELSVYCLESATEAVNTAKKVTSVFTSLP